MKILALETSGPQSQVAVLNDGKLLVRGEKAASHSRILLHMIDDALAASGLALQTLDSIAVCAGPGSFTGLRIGIAVAQGLAYCANLPVVPVSSLAALALQSIDSTSSSSSHENIVLATLDARREQIYCGWFNCVNGQVTPLGEQQVVSPAELICPANLTAHLSANSAAARAKPNGTDRAPAQAYIVGTGLAYAAAMPAWTHELHRVSECSSLPGAAAVARLGAQMLSAGEKVAATALQPIYLREKVTD